MRCDCCPNILSDVDSTARFAESGAYVNMCSTCRGFLPRDLMVVTRSDLERKDKEDEADDRVERFDLEDYDDEAESWE